MKYEEVKNRLRTALAHWDCVPDDSRFLTIDDEALKRSSYYQKLMSCGSIGRKRDGTPFPRRCHSVLCCRCSRKWSRKQARSVLSFYPTAPKEDFRCVTMMIGVTKNVNEIYPMFLKFRSGLRKDITKKQRSVKKELLAWKTFAIASSLEIDVFREREFFLLGEKKRTQLIEEMEYKHDCLGDDTVYTVHLHGVVYLGRVSESEFAVVAAKHCKSIHFRRLNIRCSRDSSIKRFMRYSSKVVFNRKLPDGRFLDWNDKTISTYAEIVRLSNQRKTCKFCMAPLGAKRGKDKPSSVLSVVRKSVDKCISLIDSDNTHSMISIYEKRYDEMMNTIRHTMVEERGAM